MELVIREIECFQMRKETIFDFIDQFEKSFIFDLIA